MPVGVFYLALKDGQGRSPVWCATLSKDVFVRIEIIEGTEDLEEGLDRAEPRDDESVMNSHHV